MRFTAIVLPPGDFFFFFFLAYRQESAELTEGVDGSRLGKKPNVRVGNEATVIPQIMINLVVAIVSMVLSYVTECGRWTWSTDGLRLCESWADTVLSLM